MSKYTTKACTAGPRVEIRTGIQLSPGITVIGQLVAKEEAMVLILISSGWILHQATLLHLTGNQKEPEQLD